jgi:hypothetical protein
MKERDEGRWEGGGRARLILKFKSEKGKNVGKRNGVSEKRRKKEFD